MIPKESRFAIFMGSASFLTLTTAINADAQQMAQAMTAEAVPEQVLVTGSLIHGAAAVGVPVTNLGVQDFTQTGDIAIGDLFRTVPVANVAPGQAANVNGGQQIGGTRVNLRGLDTTGPRSLMMIDGVRYPPQETGLCAIDPSIIPELAVDRIDILADGASATYGSDAISGVINIVLKRGYDGATTLLHAQAPDAGGERYQASQLWGRTWEGGDVTLTYEWDEVQPISGKAHSKYTVNYTPWGLDDLIPIGSSIPGTISIGKPSVKTGPNCTNCWAVPHGAGANFNASLNNGIGPLTPGSAATLNWTTFTANAANMGTNEVDPMKLGWEGRAQQQNMAVGTFDQRLLPGITFFATGFYSNRRVEEILPTFYSNGVTNDIQTFSVPTTNPYYPTGAPANLQVSYNFAHEIPPEIPAYELSDRYQFGLNLDLPFGWTGQIYDSRSNNSLKYELTLVNDNAVNAALGNTAGGVTKPAAVPYLNLFCDPAAFRCNSPQTLNYITGQRDLGIVYSLEEKGARFDGPLFDLPAGQVKAAIGGTYESDNVFAFRGNDSGGPPQSPLVNADDSEPFTVWAGFAQFDIPVLGDNLNLPLARKLDLEVSWRHDQYSSPNGALAGGTSNPKLGFTWLVDELAGATIRGSWGTSFRFANAGEYSVVSSDSGSAFNFPGQSTLLITCAGGTPTPGTPAAALASAGFGCGSAPTGIAWGGGPQAALRNYVNAATGQTATREGGTALAPEKATNYSIGFEIAPQFQLLRGLDLQATWYDIKVNNILNGFANVTSQTLSDPNQRFHFIVPSDLGCPVTANANPASCAPFEKMVLSALNDQSATLNPSEATNVYFINDGGTFGSGFLHVQGIDWNASYDWDMGNLGAWNTGITGTYYLHRLVQTITGGPVLDALHQNIQPAAGILQNGVETAPRMLYRARLGWSDGPFSVTGFVNYISHYFDPVAVPPNVNFQCTSAGGMAGGGTFPCAISNYTNIEPSMYTFDLSFGYSTGDRPANDYLKSITLQLTVQNLMGRLPAFEYAPAISNGHNATAYDFSKPDIGRVIGLTVMKNW